MIDYIIIYKILTISEHIFLKFIFERLSLKFELWNLEFEVRSLGICSLEFRVCTLESAVRNRN